MKKDMEFLMKTGGIESFEAVFSLMEQAFPQSERRTRQGQAALLEKDVYSYRILEEDGQFLGFLGVWDFGEFRFCEHFAVNENARGKGIGTKALLRWAGESESPVVLEVEPPETAIAQRRIDFYQRAGFTLNSFSYWQPVMQPGQEPIPLLLMSWPGALSEEAFHRCRDCLLREVYGVSPEEFLHS